MRNRQPPAGEERHLDLGVEVLDGLDVARMRDTARGGDSGEVCGRRRRRRPPDPAGGPADRLVHAVVDDEHGQVGGGLLAHDDELAELHEHGAVAVEAHDRAVAALAAVPASQRAALVLRHFDGYSVPEVAAMLGKSVEAVESLLARGRATFRVAYTEGCA